MNFGNNIEKMAFEKGEWPLVEISHDGAVIFMGKPPHPKAYPKEPGWIIKRITIIPDYPYPGCQTIETKYASAISSEGVNTACWAFKYDYEYVFYQP